MLRSEAVERITDGLGFRSSLADRAVARLKEAQRFMEQGKSLPWFLIQEDQALSLLSTTNTVALPDDFIREVDYETMRFTATGNTYPTFVKRKSFDDAIQAYGGTDSDHPLVYALRGTTLYFFPTADSDYDLTWSYYAKDDVLDTDIENAWLREAPEVLIGLAGMRLARDIRDKEAVAIFQPMYVEARQALLGEMAAREEAMGAGAMGENL